MHAHTHIHKHTRARARYVRNVVCDLIIKIRAVIRIFNGIIGRFITQAEYILHYWGFHKN